MMDGQLIEAGENRLQRDIDKWNNSNATFENYIKFLERRNDKFDLQYIDLLYVSNYKGGNSTIGGSQDIVNTSLDPHRKKLRKIGESFKDKSLKNLDENTLHQLIYEMSITFNMCKEDGKSCIPGFGVANCAALYHMHFPNLIPLIDRRILISSGLIDQNDKSKFLGNQVKEIESHYSKLVKRIYSNLNESGHNFFDLRSWDRYYFTLKIRKP